MQEIVTKIIVIAALVLLVWLLYRKLRRKNSGCGHAGCNECGQPCGPRPCDGTLPRTKKRNDRPLRADLPKVNRLNPGGEYKRETRFASRTADYTG